MLQIREYFADWDAHRPGSFAIERTDGRATAPPPTVDPDDLAGSLRNVVGYVHDYLLTHKEMIERRYPADPNTMSVPSGAAAGNRNISYSMGKFSLAPGEALVLELDAPRARLWTVQWLTSPWYSNADMAHRVTSVVSRHAHVDSDGKLRVVVRAHRPEDAELARHRRPPEGRHRRPLDLGHCDPDRDPGRAPLLGAIRTAGRHPRDHRGRAWRRDRQAPGQPRRPEEMSAPVSSTMAH